MSLSTTPTVTILTLILCLPSDLWTTKASGNTKPKRNICASVTERKRASQPPSFCKQNHRAGRSNINILLAKRRCICRRQKRSNTAMSESINIRKVRNSDVRIRSPPVGTATSSSSLVERIGRRSRINISTKRIAPTFILTTAAMPPEGSTSNRQSTKVMSHKRWSAEDSPLTAVKSTVKSKRITLCYES